MGDSTEFCHWIEIVDMEKTYHELENCYFEMRSNLLAETQKVEMLQNELHEEKQKREELSVGHKLEI